MDKSKCLHCGDGEPSYCEKCYQDLIGENAKLQRELSKYKQYQINIQGMRSGKTLLQNYMESSILKEELREKIQELEQVIVLTEMKLVVTDDVAIKFRYRTTIDQAIAGILVLKDLLKEGEQ